MDIADQMYGTWQCISSLTFSDEACTQPLMEPFGPNPLGRITLTPDGYMHANITHPDRALPLDKSWRSRATDEEVARVTRAMSAYCGPCKVSRRDGDVILSTKAEISLEPTWIGTIQERKVGFGERDGEKTMILKPMEPLQLPGGKLGYAVFTWVKMDPKKIVML
ncbi:uncharacterized protein PAC_18278 [Phialocephala subalpina]|uniref:Lipocalin-like domain-containing protein n=1 Tax=Phialocephala subalpina TaxID=576137 RepID=A0A1L7XTN0_9HELO|nr:uncharacterized protein PAC_18278 [Phialocephala subalpina]